MEPDAAVLNEPEMRVVPATSREAVADVLRMAKLPLPSTKLNVVPAKDLQAWI